MNNQQIKKDEAAQVGIGTMIVFIATILVAAVAAGVLIDTSQKLSSKATTTGAEATDNVGTAIEVLAVHGTRDVNTDPDLNVLRVQIRLAAGAETISLNALKVNYITSTGLTTYGAGNPTDATTAEFSTSAATLSAGQMATLIFGADTANELNIAAGSALSLEFLPQVGHSVAVDFVTPATYGTDLVFELF